MNDNLERHVGSRKTRAYKQQTPKKHIQSKILTVTNILCYYLKSPFNPKSLDP